MQRSHLVSRISCFGTLVLLLAGCDKPTIDAGFAASASPAVVSAAPASAASAAAAAAATTAEPLTGLDPCLVGSWKSTGFSLKTGQASAEGGANLALKVAPTGDALVDFGPMAAIEGKAGGANFDFQYSGTAKATLKTPTRGALASSNADYAPLKVSVNVEMPGAGKVSLFKAKPVTELAQMAAAVSGGKPQRSGAAPLPGVDASPIFSTSSYSCEGDTLTLDGGKVTANWKFTRVKH